MNSGRKKPTAIIDSLLRSPSPSSASSPRTRASSTTRNTPSSSSQENTNLLRPSAAALGTIPDAGSVLTGACSRRRSAPCGVAYTTNQVGPLRPSAARAAGAAGDGEGRDGAGVCAVGVGHWELCGVVVVVDGRGDGETGWGVIRGAEFGCERSLF